MIMADIEKRLAALEIQATRDAEFQHALRGQIKALSLVIDCISKPLCLSEPRLAETVLMSLETVEKEARRQNQHADFFWQIGQARNFFEARMAENRKH
jgi:hypothetical protein